MIESEIKNGHLIKMLMFNQFLNKKFSLVFITLLSLFVTYNDEAVRILWGEPIGYITSAIVFSVWFFIYLVLFILILFLNYYFNKSLRRGLGTYTFEITDSGLLEKSHLGELLMSWESIVNVHKRRDRVYIERDGDHWAIILKSGNEEEYDGFISQILSHTA